MSTAARRVPSRTPPARRRNATPAPAERTVKRSPQTGTSTRTRPRSSATARRFHLGFAVVFAFVVVPMILGLVALNAVLAQTSFRIDDLTTHVNDLTNRNAELRKSVAVGSAPEQVAAWAEKNGFQTPDPHDVHVLHPPTHGGGGGP